MVRNKIQDERMKNYFRDAAKELIRGEGLSVISARNVAERAGYSYATLYNYFKDIRDLVFQCTLDFIDECSDFIEKETSSISNAEEALSAKVNSYIRYFVQYPDIYELIYFRNVKQIATGKSDLSEFSDFLYSVVKDELEELKISKNSTDLLMYSLHGVFSLYFSRRVELDYKKLTEKANEIISLILKK
jgi:AcrR family transcriptional regulator